MVGMSASINLDNAPRDLEGLTAGGRPLRYRLCLSLGLVEPNSDEEKAFFSMSTEEQAQFVLDGLLARDATKGNGKAVQTAPTPADIEDEVEEDEEEPEEDESLMQPPQRLGPPQPMAPPTTMAKAPPQPFQRVSDSGTVVKRTPSTKADPNNSGEIAAQVASPEGPKLLLGAMQKIVESNTHIHKTVEALGEGYGNLYDLVAELQKQNKVAMMIALYAAQETMGLTQEVILQMAVSDLQEGALDQLVQGEPSGK